MEFIGWEAWRGRAKGLRQRTLALDGGSKNVSPVAAARVKTMAAALRLVLATF